MIIRYDEVSFRLKQMLGVDSSYYQGRGGDYAAFNCGKTLSGTSFVTPCVKTTTKDEKGVGYYSADHQRKGFSICGKSQPYGIVCIGPDFNLYIEEETLMPSVIRQPEDLEDALLLIEQDPRFARIINPVTLAGETEQETLENMEIIQKAVKKAYKRIMKYQPRLGVLYDEQESEEVSRYSLQCAEAVKEFVVNSRKYFKSNEALSNACSEKI